MDKVELLNCPFCGAPAESSWIDNDHPIAIVSCSECPALVELYSEHWSRATNEAEAVAAWNTRLSPAPEGVDARELLVLEWRDGAPPHPWDKEWFIALTTYGDRVVLRALPEEYTYDFKGNYIHDSL